MDKRKSKRYSGHKKRTPVKAFSSPHYSGSLFHFKNGVIFIEAILFLMCLINAGLILFLALNFSKLTREIPKEPPREEAKEEEDKIPFKVTKKTNISEEEQMINMYLWQGENQLEFLEEGDEE